MVGADEDCPTGKSIKTQLLDIIVEPVDKDARKGKGKGKRSKRAQSKPKFNDQPQDGLMRSNLQEPHYEQPYMPSNAKTSSQMDQMEKLALRVDNLEGSVTDLQKKSKKHGDTLERVENTLNNNLGAISAQLEKLSIQIGADRQNSFPSGSPPYKSSRVTNG